MADDARIHGSNGAVLIQDPGSPAYNPIGDISAFTLNMSRARVEVIAFRDTNVRRVQGLPDYQGDLNGWWNAANSTYLDALMAGEAIGLRLVPEYVNDPDVYYQGQAFIDGALSVSATGAGQITGSWVAADNWASHGI